MQFITDAASTDRLTGLLLLLLRARRSSVDTEWWNDRDATRQLARVSSRRLKPAVSDAHNVGPIRSVPVVSRLLSSFTFPAKKLVCGKSVFLSKNFGLKYKQMLLKPPIWENFRGRIEIFNTCNVLCGKSARRSSVRNVLYASNGRTGVASSIISCWPSLLFYSHCFSYVVRFLSVIFSLILTIHERHYSYAIGLLVNVAKRLR